MSLDLFGSTIAAADQNVAQNAARDLPAEFPETLDVAWRSMTEWHNSVGYSVAQSNALGEYRDYIRQKTGETLPHLGTNSQANELNDYVSLDDFNMAQAKIAEQHPDLGLQPLSAADLDTMARRRMAKAHDDAAAMDHRETTWGGTAGTALGVLGGGLADPVMLATLPLGGAGEAGIALRALEFAGIAGGTEAATAAINFRAREAAVPGSSKEIPGEIAGAALFGGALGAGFGALAKLLGHGAKPLPTSVRDEVNAATSELQFHATNPFPTAAGETAARDATVEATTSLVKGETVRAADNFEAGHVADYALAAKAATPEQLALAGEAHLRPETFGEAPNVERFDRMPSETDDTASYWDKKLAAASPEERAALGATDAVQPNWAGNDLSYVGKHVSTPKSEQLMGFGEGLEPTLVGEKDGVKFYMDKFGGSIYAATGERKMASGIEIGPSVGTVKTTMQAGERVLDHAVVSADFRRKGIGSEMLDLLQRSNPEIRFDKNSGLVSEDGAALINSFNRRSEHIAARDLTPEQVTKLAADPATDSAVLHNLEHIMLEKPDMEFSTQVRQADGSYQLVTQKLSDVLAELDGLEAAGKELEACAAGLAIAAE